VDLPVAPSKPLRPPAPTFDEGMRPRRENQVHGVRLYSEEFSSCRTLSLVGFVGFRNATFCICTTYPEGLVGTLILHKYLPDQRAEQPERNGPMYTSGTGSPHCRMTTRPVLLVLAVTAPFWATARLTCLPFCSLVSILLLLTFSVCFLF
jgi:hypothetical protein